MASEKPESKTKKPAISIPHYRLRTGDNWLFSRRKKQVFGKSVGFIKNRIYAWVVEENETGWEMITALVQPLRPNQPELEHSQVELSRFVLTRDGRRLAAKDTALTPYGYLFELFPRLPMDEVTARSGWTEDSLISASIAKSSVSFSGITDLDRDPLPISAKAADVISETLTERRNYTFQFSQREGMVQKVSAFGVDEKGEKTGARLEVLPSLVEHKSAQWMKQFALEAQLIDKAKAEYEAMLGEAFAEARKSNHDEKLARDLVARSQKVLEALTPNLADPFMKQALRSQLRVQDAVGRGILEIFDKEGKMLNRPAPEWDAVDLQGKLHHSKDYLGKVVLLNFWETNCWPCLTVMPLLSKIAEAFKGAPVEVIGINPTDSLEEVTLAQDKLKLSYPLLSSKAAGDAFKINGFPTSILIDQKGVVRRFISNSMSFPELKALVEELLK